tara:strand:- start:35 stop:487 length:453 start_codon:yes stop_codon:yes gene_type:complete
MGYTHYWNIYQTIIPQDIWRSFASDFIKILPQFMDKLDHETDQKFDINGNDIRFNGIGEESHETFTINRKNPMEKSYDGEIKYFDFCKTARKEYDIAVCCALIIAKKHFADIIGISSDGCDEDGWDKAKELCQKRLKYGKNFDINGGKFI